jgi:hypothetical protein
VADETEEERGVERHLTLLEVLKQLNRADIEETDVAGFERREIFLTLRKGPVPTLTEEELGPILETLVGNQMVERVADPSYAWDRGRILGERYTITLVGKEYLMQQIEKTGRVE